MEKALPFPSKQPGYRVNRSHTDFLVNLRLPAHLVKQALAKAWNASERLPQIPFDKISDLAREKYSRDEWNFKF